MKKLLPYLPALLILSAGSAWYWHGSRGERRLRERVAQLTLAEKKRALPNWASPTIDRPDVPDPNEIPATLTTPDAINAFLTHWTTEALAEQAKLLATGKMDLKMYDPFHRHVASMSPLDLMAICQTAPEDARLDSFNESSGAGPRAMLFYNAYDVLRKNHPFLALRLPQNQPGGGRERLYNNVLPLCAERDPAEAWRVVREKYGGVNAPARTLQNLLEGAGGDDVAERLRFAREWGLLNRVAGLWTKAASESPAAQDAWLAAVREASPPGAEDMVSKFAGEIETGEGFEGVKRVIDRLAEPGTALRDRILREAATPDLEENADAKADWILAETSPANVIGTAEALMQNWTAADPMAASQWLDRAPASAPWRSAAVLAFAAAIAPHDPEAAQAWRMTADR